MEFAVGRKGMQFSLSCLSVHRPIKTLTLPNYLSLFHLSFPSLLYLFISQADIDSSLLSPMSQFSSAQSLSRVQLFAPGLPHFRQTLYHLSHQGSGKYPQVRSKDLINLVNSLEKNSGSSKKLPNFSSAILLSNIGKGMGTPTVP